jgi:hypothetical protein
MSKSNVKKPEVLTSHSADNLILWRDTASQRISKRDVEITKLAKKLNLLNKSNVSDVRWVKKLNGAITKKAFGHPTPVRPIVYEVVEREVK